jgi:hypothetical protein
MRNRGIPTRAYYREYCHRKSREGVQLYELGEYSIFYRVASDCFEIYKMTEGGLRQQYVSYYFAWCIKKVRSLGLSFGF